MAKGLAERAREQNAKEMAKQGRCECGLKFSKSNPKLKETGKCKMCSEKWIDAPVIERYGEQVIA